jgi:hypothetical protein
MIVSWLLPGSGHFILKKRLKGLAFFCGISLMLALGILMHGKFFSTRPFHPLLILGFIGDLGNGLFYFLIKALGLAGGDIHAVTFHYGTTYLAAAGLLNYLIALNAYDVAKGRRK